MSFTTYTLVVRENGNSEGIVAEVRADGSVEDSTSVSYDDYGLTAISDDWLPNERHNEFDTDATTIRLETERDGEGFLFRVVGDGETITEQRVTDDGWNVVAVQ